MQSLTILRRPADEDEVKDEKRFLELPWLRPVAKSLEHIMWYFIKKIFSFAISGMRTARNIFIATLAVADLMLCLLTMPMTLLGVLTKYWPFGTSTWILCKIVRTSPAITIFFSSYTMAVIALDRHRFIVHSTKRQVCARSDRFQRVLQNWLD